MSQISRLTVYQTLLESRFLPLFFDSNPDVAQNVTRSCVEGGARVLEFTNRGEDALEVFISLRKFIDQQKIPMILGVGSVVDSATAAVFIAYGADFIVGPSHDIGISCLCNKRKIAYIPGCQTVNEISRAEEYGAEIVKVFPGSCVGGPRFISNILGPMPWSRLLPTGGVEPEEESLHAWFKAGAAAVGMGSKLIRKEWVSTGQYGQIRELTAKVVKWIKHIQ